MKDLVDITESIKDIPVTLFKIDNAKTVWFNESSELRERFNYSNSTFFENISYLIPNNDFFTKIEVSDIDYITMECEQYGGRGIYFNGGGARSVNYNNIQLKGVGVTPVVGKHDNLYCSSGVYPLYEALTEAINSTIFSAILPIGIVEYLSLVHIGETDLFVTADKCTEKQKGTYQLAIGFREQSKRLGTFFRAGYFKPLEKFKHLITNDVYRVKSLFTTLNSNFGGVDSVINEFFVPFLINSSKQMAFTRVNRIAHGALTPSNITCCGKWLDLTNTTMVPSGIDYFAGYADPTFLNEKDVPVDFMVELLDQYGKYNKTLLNSKPLKEFYYEQYQQYYLLNIVSLFGIPYVDNVKPLLSLHDELSLLKDQYETILNNSFIPKKGVPVHKPNENIILDHVTRVFNLLPSNGTTTLEFNAISIVINYYHTNYNTDSSYNSFVICCLIRALRKLVYCHALYIGRIYLLARKIVQFEIEKIESTIKAFQSTTNWMFGKEDKNKELIIFQSEMILIKFVSIEDQFSVIQEKNLQSFETASSLYEYINLCDQDVFTHLGYSFKEDVLILIDAVSAFERRNLLV